MVRQPLDFSQPPHPVHGHKGGFAHSSNIEIVDPMKNLSFPKDANKSRLLKVFKGLADIELLKPVTVELKEDEEQREDNALLRFQFQALPDGQPQTVTLTLEEWENSCRNDLALKNSYIECTIVGKRIDKGKKVSKTLKSFRVFLTGQNKDFAIWNAETVPRSISSTSFLLSSSAATLAKLSPPTPVKLITTSAPVEKYGYKVQPKQNESSFVNIVDSLSEGKDWCYSVELKNLSDTAKMDVFLTFDEAPQGTQIASLTASNSHEENRFCINEYLPFANLARYQLSFSFAQKTEGKPFSPFFFEYSKQAVGNNFRLISPSSLSKAKSLTANQWLYFDLDIDYTITKKAGKNSQLAFSFCDQTLNCFPFEEEVDKSSQLTVYKLPEFASQKVLVNSPFVRLKIDNFKKDQLDSYTFAYFSEESKKSFEAKKLAEKQSSPGPMYKASSSLPKCPPNFEADYTLKTCKLSSKYVDHTVECDLKIGCSNIFAVPLMSTTRYYNAATLDKNSITYLPYQTATSTTEAFLTIPISENDRKENKDPCVTFSYLSRSSPLFISTNLKSKVSVELPVMGATSPTFGHACASWFARSASKVEAFFLRFETFEKGAPLTDIDGHLVTLTSSALQVRTFPQDVTIEGRGVFKDDKLDSIFVPFSPLSVGSQLIKATSNSIEYLLPGVKTLSKSSQLTQVSYLRSKWIRLSRNLANKLLLSWTADLSSSLISDAFETSLIIGQDGGLDLLTLSGQSFLEPQRSNPQTLSVPANYVQLIIKVRVNLTATTPTTTSSDQLTFKLTDLLLNDPCHLNLNPNDGNFIQCEKDKGHCTVDSYADYTTKCACVSSWYFGKLCDQVNFCAKENGESDCRKVGGFDCTNNQATRSFDCKCGGSRVWDLSTRT